MINAHIEIIKNNHLKHIEKDLSSVKNVMWGVGFLMLTQMIIVIRGVIFG
jgi:hypothetical protein